MIYLMYLLLAFNAFVNGMSWMNLAAYGITAGGGVLCIWMFLRWKRYKKAVGIVLLELFALSYAVSAVTHISYAGAVENAKGFIWLVLPSIVLYASAFDMSKEEMHKELTSLASLYVVYCTVADTISLSMLAWGWKYDYTDPAGTIHSIGYRWGRLWGIYDDPNHGATISAIAVFFLIYLFGKTRKLWQKVLLVICGVIQYAYIAFSDSRTGILCLVTGLVFYTILQIVGDRHTAGKRILILTITAAAIFAGDVALKAAYAPVDAMMRKREAQKISSSVNNERKQKLKQDYSNGRMELWGSGLEIMESSPVIGVGYRNMSGYAQQHFPDSYMVKNAAQIRYDSMHNLELDVLVSQGIAGMVVFLALLIHMLWKIIRSVSALQKADDHFIAVMLSAALALGVASTFLSFIFYVNASQSFCFWLFLGYGMNALMKEKEAPNQ